MKKHVAKAYLDIVRNRTALRDVTTILEHEEEKIKEQMSSTLTPDELLQLNGKQMLLRSLQRDLYRNSDVWEAEYQKASK